MQLVRDVSTIKKNSSAIHLSGYIAGSESPYQLSSNSSLRIFFYGFGTAVCQLSARNLAHEPAFARRQFRAMKSSCRLIFECFIGCR